MSREQLTRDVDNSMLGGVCAGVARHYDFDVTVVRIVWLIVTVFSMGTGIILYIAAWVIMPRPDQVSPPPPEGGYRDRGAQFRPPDPPENTLPARERVIESGRVLLTHARRSAEEIADIARGNPPPPPNGNGATPSEAQPGTPGETPPAASSETAPGAGDDSTPRPSA